MASRALNAEITKVAILDLLSESDRQKWGISQEVMRHLASIGVPQETASINNKAGLTKAFEYFEKLAESDRLLIQVTAHGNEKGVGLGATGEFIGWDEFRPWLKRVNQKLAGDLVVNMVACKGVYGEAIHVVEDRALPFFGLVGPLKNIEVNQAKRVTNMFYDEMLRGHEIPLIVNKINQSEGDKLLWCSSSQSRLKAAGKTLSL